MDMFAKEDPHMLKLLIVEDDDETAKTIEKFLTRYFSRTETEIEVGRYKDAQSFLGTYPRDADVVFMDIELPGMNGMDAVRELRKTDGDVTVIFVTNLAQYAVSGYEVNAFDFIVKPVSYGSFSMKLRRLVEYLGTKRNCEICVSTRRGKVLVRASDIKYVEIMRHVVTYHTVNGNVVGSGTLKNVMAMLDGLPFALCNRCYLVSLQYVTEIVGKEVCVGGEKLLIAAPRRKEFLTAFNEYLGAGGRVK